jgi:hypothetical protein
MKLPDKKACFANVYRINTAANRKEAEKSLDRRIKSSATMESWPEVA